MGKFLLMVFVAMMSLCSCSNDDINDSNKDLVGKEDDMVISADNAVLDSCKDETALCVNVPAEGKTFTLQVNNYSEWWINTVSLKKSANDNYVLQKVKDFYNVEYADWYKVEITSNRAKFTVLPNSSSETRTIKVEMTAGDIFRQINIVQANK